MRNVSFVALYDEYCLGVRYMSSVLQEAGHNVDIILFKSVVDITPADVPPQEEWQEGGYYSMATYITHVIGISFTSISFGVAKFISQKIKAEFPDAVIVWGGVDSTVNIRENIQYTDAICMGEGEYPMRSLVNALDKGNDYTKIPSLWVSKDGQIHQNGVMRLPQNLDEYPMPDFEPERKTVIYRDAILEGHFPPESHLYSNYLVMAARGCPFTCTYCCSGHDRQTYKKQNFLRRRSVDNVLDELEYMIDKWPWTIERIELYDDVLPIDVEWLREFTPKYKDRIGLPFFGYTHPNVGEPESLHLLKDAGCDYIIMGIQSGSQRVLTQYYDRRHTKERTLRTAQNILDAGIKLVCDFIGYNPLIKEEDNIETLDLICDLPKPWGIIKFNPMAFYDGYRLTEIARKEGIMDQLERPEGVHAYQAKITNDLIFWEYILTLGHFNGFTKEKIMDLVHDKHIRENPQILEQIVTNLYKATYMDSNPVVNKDRYALQLGQDLGVYQQSKLLRAYRKVRSLVA